MNRRTKRTTTRKTRRTTAKKRPTTFGGRRTVTRMKAWTPSEVSQLKKFYRTNPNSFIAKKLKRSEGSVQYKASSLGLRKSATYLRQIRNNWA